MITPSFSLTATERVLPKLALDFTTASLDARVTFTRTTDATHPATYVNSSGVVTSATNNQPRFDYDPVSLVCKGLLIEESRSNIALYSDDFTNWTASTISLSSDATLSPLGTPAQLLSDGTSNGFHAYSAAGFSATGGATYTASVYAKAGTAPYIWMSVRSAAGNYAGVIFNLATQALTTSSTAGTGFSVVSTSVTDAGNGWHRYSYTFVPGATSTVLWVGLSQVTTFTSSGYITTYTGTNKTAYVDAVQCEAGAFATSYIPTTTAALTRNADVATMTGTNFSDWFNASEGTYAAQFLTQFSGSSSASRYILVADDSSSKRILYIGSGGSNAVSYDGTTVLTAIGGDITGQISTAVSSYGSNREIASVGGTPYSASMAAGYNTQASLQIGNISGVAQICGWVSKINYWPRQLTTSEIQAFSKG